MKPLHQILPGLELAVASRRADPQISSLDEGDLRTLIYELSRHYLRQREDPDVAYEDMARAANVRAAKLAKDRLDGIRLRTEILDRILSLGQLAMPSLASPLRTRIVRYGSEQQYTSHPNLRGIELATSRKQLNGEDGRRTIMGRSWWVVCSSPEQGACWAILEHNGSIDAESRGEEKIRIDPSDPDELARQLNEKVIGQMLICLGQQIRDAQTATASAEITKLRAKLDAIVRLLQDDDDVPIRVAR